MFNLRRLLRSQYMPSYAQSGEDAIARFLFQCMGIYQPSYLDIGANDPIKFNNTYGFYRSGSKGVCIEANPAMVSRLRRVRPRDTIINCAVVDQSRDSIEFYVNKADTLSTADVDQVKRLGDAHQWKSVTVPAKTLTQACEAASFSEYDFVSLDIEGRVDGLIDQRWLSTYKPKVLCVETLEFDPSGAGKKDVKMMNFLIQNGFAVYADTYINTIFINPSLLSFQIDPSHLGVGCT